jgi:hypothetical protein
MPVVLTLWRRAPVWRSLTIVAGVMTALAALYPPMSLHDNGSRTPAASYHSPARQETATPAPSPSAVYGRVYRGTVPLGGHWIPLPPGDWTALARMPFQAADGIRSEGAFLAKIVNNQLVAAVRLLGNGPESLSATGFPLETGCQRPGWAHVASNVDYGRQDCWWLGYEEPPSWDGDAKRRLLAAAVAELKLRKVPVPPLMVFAVFKEADAREYVSLVYWFNPEVDGIAPPGPGDPNGSSWSKNRIAETPEKLAYMQRLERWAEEWADAVRETFAGHLAEGPLPARWADRLP